jgi:hypothetical protein
MKTKYRNFFSIAAITFLVCRTAFAGGSLPFSDLKELLAQQPVLAKFISEHLDVAEIGTGSRVGGRVNEELSGSRVAPYEFNAKPKGAKGDFTLMLVIEAETSFLDANGKEVRVEKGTKIQERLTGIRLRLPTAEER